MELDKNKLLIKQLPPTIYIKNFIDGHPANYEDFSILQNLSLVRAIKHLF